MRFSAVETGSWGSFTTARGCPFSSLTGMIVDSNFAFPSLSAFLKARYCSSEILYDHIPMSLLSLMVSR